MTKMEDLLWLYKMAIEYNLVIEKNWLKEHIEEQLGTSSHSFIENELNNLNSPLDTDLDTSKVAA